MTRVPFHDPGRAARHAALRAAQDKAERLFDEVVRRGLIRPGATERSVSAAVFDLAQDLFGVRRHWHKRVVRAGPNTLCPYRENPPDRAIGDDDIVFLDFGPVFGAHEADFGRTYVLGDDPLKKRLQADASAAWRRGKELFDEDPGLTGAALYAAMTRLAAEYGWEFGGEHAGHLIGEFPHEEIQGDEVVHYIHRDNPGRLRDPDAEGRPRDWILEVHLVDRARGIGAFVEELLSVD